jgi:uncharacterized protein YyaL (SSP411 family)
MPTNRLAHEKSPYLLQHAENPVDWYPWGEEAFEKARSEDKPIFLSIGYSTCHWCHVMERESFESEEIAAILNRSFVPIKVDREERPDVDRIYMTFVQATTGSGGWPMSVWLTPDLKPFFGGTYFPPDNRYGRPGFASVLQQLAMAWVTDRARVMTSAASIVEQLQRASAGQAQPMETNEEAVRERLFFHFRRSFDSRYGGFGSAPKFPRPSAVTFLLREGKWADNEEACDMALTTLREMAKGGMYDHLGGGFHRYSVDARWFVPHFEKMLYDQAQLAIAYLEAYQVSGEAVFAATAREIFDYVRRDLRHPEGGFYSAEDADSVIDPAHPHEKGEGAFYVWTHAELGELLGPEMDWFARRFGVETGGNVREDPHSEFTGRNILYLADASAGLPGDLARVQPLLLEARSKRPRPHLDDKVLTAWNGLMISAFAKGAQVLGDPGLLDTARSAELFLRERLMARDGSLLRRWREGEAAVQGFLDDYAFFVQALLDLYETEFDQADLDLAVRLTEAMIAKFADGEGGGFYSTAEGDPSLVMRLKDDYDGAEPSGNSIAILNLLRLEQITREERFGAIARQALKAFGRTMETQPAAAPQMIVALAASQRKAQQVVIAGERAATAELLRTAHRAFAPFRVLLWNPPGGMFPPVEGKPTAYVCEDFTCELPVGEPDQLAGLLI